MVAVLFINEDFATIGYIRINAPWAINAGALCIVTAILSKIPILLLLITNIKAELMIIFTPIQSFSKAWNKRSVDAEDLQNFKSALTGCQLTKLLLNGCKMS